MDIKEESAKMHERLKGKLEIKSKIPLRTKRDFSLAYTPGVAEPCLRIFKNKEDVYKYTIKGNTVAVISNGTAVLGLGDIGAEAAIPVMEGKAAIFKELANIDAFPLCIDSKDVKINIEIIKKISPIFGGINLEDYKAPECFEIEEGLQGLGIPVMHDDQHGTAVVVLAGILNALKVVDKKLEHIKISISGAGAAAIAVTKLLIKTGADPGNIMMVDRIGIIYEGREDLQNNKYKKEVSLITNQQKKEGFLADAIKETDVFIGLSTKGLVSKEMIRSMNKKAIIFAMANPEPEVTPADAKEAGAEIIATGRSDFPNQVNNALAFPGIFRGALDVRAKKITDEMKIAASKAIASLIETPSRDRILPFIYDKEVVKKVSEAVKNAYVKSKL